MSINWLWKNKCGEATIKQLRKNGNESAWNEFTVSLYEGNAFLIMLYEYKDDDGQEMYNMFSFFVDKTHAKKCLGLQKNEDGEIVNMFDDNWQKLTKLRINKAKCRYKDIVSMFAQAFDNLAIEIYNEE